MNERTTRPEALDAAGAAAPRARSLIVPARPWATAAALVLAATMAVTATGCAGGSAPIRYHAPAPVAPLAGASYGSYAGPPVVVRGLQLPPGNDRTEMTRPLADGSFEIRESDRWAAPLGRLARQALVEDLALRLPAGSVVVPGADWPAARVEVTVDVLSYRVADGVATLALSWRVRSSTADGVTSPASTADRMARIDRAASVRLQAPVAGDEASTWSALIGQVADRVAAAVANGAREDADR